MDLKLRELPLRLHPAIGVRSRRDHPVAGSHGSGEDRGRDRLVGLNRVTVTGAVKDQGSLKPHSMTAVLDAVMAMGGFTSDAKIAATKSLWPKGGRKFR